MHPPKFSRWIDKQRTMGNFSSRRSTFNYRSLLENFGTRVGELAKILLEQLVKVEVTLRGILREDRRKREVWREGWKAYVVKFLSRSFIATKRISHEPGFTNRRVSKELSINVLNNNVRKLRAFRLETDTLVSKPKTKQQRERPLCAIEEIVTAIISDLDRWSKSGIRLNRESN